MRTKSLSTLAILIAACTLITPAFGLSCSGTLFTLTAGSIGSIPADAAQACITLSSGVITVVLENDTSTANWNVPNVLDGFSFSVSQGTVTGPLDITNVSGGFFNCTGSGCVTDPNFTSQQGGGSTLSEPYSWGAGFGASTYGSGNTPATFSATNPGFFAGCTNCNASNVGTNFSLHPAGIVNSTANGPGDDPHNDLLVGDVTFTLHCTGCSSETFSNAIFYWGTDGTTGGGGVPEPTSILLLGTALAVAGKMLNRRLSA